MDETFVRLVCPSCTKNWQRPPSELPTASTSFDCPDCNERESLSEFARTDKDLQTLKKF